MPGLDGTGELFAPLVSRLPENFNTTVIRYPPNTPLGYEELLSLLYSVVPTSAPFILIAESFSTPLAIQFAATKPTNLRAVILCAGFAKGPMGACRRRLISLVAPLLFRLPPSVFAIKALLLGNTNDETLIASIRSAIASVPANVLVVRLREALACDVSASLRKMAIPLLYLRAEDDRLIGGSNADDIRQLKPDAIFVKIRGPHLLFQCHPEQTAAIITDFVQRHLIH